MVTNLSGLVVDSNVWVALTDAQDSLRSQATEALATLPPTLNLLTTNYIFAETVTVISQKRGRALAREFGQRFFKRVDRRELQYIRVSAEIESRAWELFQAVTGKNVSLVDCIVASVAVGTPDLGVFSFDKDLKQLGRKLGFEVIGT